MKDINGITTTVFRKFLDESNRKPNKIWVDKGGKFYNRSMKSWLKDNDIEVYSTHKEGISVLAKRFIGTLTNKIYKYMTLMLKTVYINKLANTDNEHNNTYHSTIKLEVGDHVRISKYKKIAKDYIPNWSEEVSVIKKVKNSMPLTYVIEDLNGEEIFGTFYEKELQKRYQTEFRVEKVIKENVKWKDYDNSFNSWIDKKEIVI